MDAIITLAVFITIGGTIWGVLYITIRYLRLRQDHLTNREQLKNHTSSNNLKVRDAEISLLSKQCENHIMSSIKTLHLGMTEAVKELTTETANAINELTLLATQQNEKFKAIGETLASLSSSKDTRRSK